MLLSKHPVSAISLFSNFLFTKYYSRLFMTVKYLYTFFIIEKGMLFGTPLLFSILVQNSSDIIFDLACHTVKGFQIFSINALYQPF